MSNIPNDLLPALFVASIPSALALFAFISRNDNLPHEKTFKAYERKKKLIFVIETSKQWESFWAKAESEVEHTKVIGFDCEWVPFSKPIVVDVEEEEEEQLGDNVTEAAPSLRKVDGRVSLIQIATVSGLCGLVRILNLEDVPDSLRLMLGNKNILKLGVSPKDDGNRLWRDHG